MEITRRASKWTVPKPTTEAHVCDIDATHALTHSVSNRFGRKKAPAVASCMTTLGHKLYLCSHCVSYVEVVQWLDKIRYTDDIATGKLAALGYVWRSKLGFVMPAVRDFEGSCQTLGMVAHHLAGLVKEGIVKRIDGRYLLRDACPACYRRGGCDKECMLHMGEDFAQRREAQL